jgi:hypothetical protein
MSDVIKNMRRGADRAAFEASKLVRLQRAQHEQKACEQQRRDCLEELGEATWQLYAQGRISDPELVSICHQVQTTTHQLAELDQTVAQLRSEQAPKPAKCLDCGHDIGPSDAFCPFCGAKARIAEPEPPKPAAPTCPGCQRAVRPGAVFCSHCGRRQAEPGL